MTIGKTSFQLQPLTLQPMLVKNDILALSRRGKMSQGDLELVQSRKSTMQGGIQYQVQRYRRFPEWSAEDVGMLVYHVDPAQEEESYLELKFCITGNVYCRNTQGACRDCKDKTEDFCGGRVDTLDVLSFRFNPGHLAQYARGKDKSDITYSILSFERTTTFSKALSINNKTKLVLEQVLNSEYEESLANIFIHAQTQILLLYSMECMLEDKVEAEALTFTCKFLSNETDREKVTRARELLLENLGDPITIKELSKKVAMNECYLKKGFKEMFGTTIFDFYQNERMNHARHLLYERGLSVTEVSMMLGYSSISHFSTAFKKQTGLKPCELLLR